MKELPILASVTFFSNPTLSPTLLMKRVEKDHRPGTRADPGDRKRGLSAQCKSGEEKRALTSIFSAQEIYTDTASYAAYCFCVFVLSAIPVC
jgi:hypothetical protein